MAIEKVAVSTSTSEHRIVAAIAGKTLQYTRQSNGAKNKNSRETASRNPFKQPSLRIPLVFVQIIVFGF